MKESVSKRLPLGQHSFLLKKLNNSRKDMKKATAAHQFSQAKEKRNNIEEKHKKIEKNIKQAER